METGPASSHELLSRAFAVWRKAQVVYQSPSRQGQPEALAFVEEIATHHPEWEPALVAAIHDDSQLVVAYALLTLELMNSAALEQLPAEVLERRSNITLHLGSFRNAMDVGGLARQVQKRARQRAADQNETQ